VSLAFARFAAAWLSLACTLYGCATTITPPQSPVDPVEVFVVDHGRTTSLVIPSSSAGALRYAYGDWNYYALGRKDLFHGIAALLWPTPSALGRAEFQTAATEEDIRTQVHSIEALHVIHVERAQVHAFEQRMETLYNAGRGSEVENLPTGLRFVPHPRRYTYFWNSNHAVASWLRELGCRTRGASFRASWRIVGIAGPHETLGVTGFRERFRPRRYPGIPLSCH
jgi:hypothetical protein